ncbi:heavy metal transporter [Rhodospirillum rubrum]|uniref:heavy-metal-associated domain-containing protein n=1 Tax=Rhodospirillum rubrum TaxID=1085 RepID=UPI001906EF4E|nr:heavy-metal-associated domain-containing protein [Rhodospirillum rubrum]MBK1663687.1 heavy metal transporter [Rhodospirillum rubrum]MBK1677427.1 heavy metal transporter [Rhodospirillum rubrum]
MAKTYLVGGMTCGGCARSVERAIKSLTDDADLKVVVDLEGGCVSVEGLDDDAAIEAAVDGAGFDYLGPKAA